MKTSTTRHLARGSLGLLAVTLAAALLAWALWHTLGGADLLGQLPLRIIVDGDTVFDGDTLGPLPPLLGALAVVAVIATLVTVVPLALLGVGLLVGMVVLGVIGVPVLIAALVLLLLLSPLWLLYLLLRRLLRDTTAAGR